MPNVSICVCHPDEQHCQAIVSAFLQHDDDLSMVTVTDLPRALEVIRAEETGIVVVAVDAPGDPALHTVSAIQADKDLTPGIIAVSQNPSRELLVACMRAGCDEFLEFPIQQQELAGALDRQYRKHGILAQAPGKVIAVYGAKGGTGVTTIAANLAAGIARQRGGDSAACIIDFNPCCGNVALMLDVREFAHSLADATRDAERLDASLLSTYMARHESGAAVLPASLNLDDGAEVDADSLAAVVTQCRQIYDHVIVDLPHALETATLAGLDAADQVYLICDMTLPAIHNTKRIVDVFRELEIKKSRLKLIVNRYYDSDQISLQELSNHIQLPIYWVIPYDSSVAIAAVNSGRAFDRVDEGSEAAMSLVALAQDTAAMGETATVESRGASRMEIPQNRT